MSLTQCAKARILLPSFTKLHLGLRYIIYQRRKIKLNKNSENTEVNVRIDRDHSIDVIICFASSSLLFNWSVLT
jgi:hypothetical protein